MQDDTPGYTAPPLRQNAWILSDGHAGNVRQARALAIAIGLTETREWALQPRAPWRWFAPRRWPAASHAFGETYRQVSANPPAVAIGCGRQAALATRLLRERGTRAVQILDPRIDARHWDLVVAPAHDELHGPNVVTLQGSLHPVDDLWLAAGRQQFAVFTSLPRPRTAVLVGGASAHGGLHTAALGAYLDRLAERVAAEGGSVLATASRRTPAAASAMLRAKLSTLPHDVWCDERDGANPYAGLLGWADRIVCTADSVNMLSEAAATNVPVFALGIDALQGRPRRFVDSLVAMGRVRAFDGELAPFPVVPLRETARVAAEVRQRLGL
ncbi:mitochondrial fission ELM1 family protein [Lysobacter terrae]